MFNFLKLSFTPLGKTLIGIEIAVISILLLFFIALVIHVKKDTKTAKEADSDICEEIEYDELFAKVYGQSDECETAENISVGKIKSENTGVEYKTTDILSTANKEIQSIIRDKNEARDNDNIKN